MAKTNTCEQRSRLSKAQSFRSGPAGQPRNKQDFSELSATAPASAQEYHQKNWHYMSKGRLHHLRRLSTKFHSANGEEHVIDQKSGQFAFTLE